jgi:hypothetical protein
MNSDAFMRTVAPFTLGPARLPSASGDVLIFGNASRDATETRQSGYFTRPTTACNRKSAGKAGIGGGLSSSKVHTLARGMNRAEATMPARCHLLMRLDPGLPVPDAQ